jgi:allantoicase
MGRDPAPQAARPLGASLSSCQNFESWTHLRVNIYPDGGIARLRVYGVPELDEANSKGEIDLAAALNGGRILGFSDAHYGDYSAFSRPGAASTWATAGKPGGGASRAMTG